MEVQQNMHQELITFGTLVAPMHTLLASPKEICSGMPHDIGRAEAAQGVLLLRA